MRRLLIVSSCVLLLAAMLVPGSGAATGASCPARVDGKHVVRVRSDASLVHDRSGNRKELVVRHVGRFGQRLARAGGASCRVDLDAFAGHWTKVRTELHARLTNGSGSWAIRVRFVDYDAERHVLRARGELEDSRAGGRQMNNATELVYASTFVPFDSSF